MAVAKQADHLQPFAVGGRKVVRLRVIGGYVEIDDYVPATRAECKNGPRPCSHVRCEWHLWLQRGEDGPGRRVAGRPPATTLRPVWLDWPLPPSCGADIADALGAMRELMPIGELARAHDIRPSRVHEIIADCLRKLGIERKDLRALLHEDEE